MTKLIKGINDLETWCRENNKESLIQQWDYSKNDIRPSDIYCGSSKKIWWTGECGHSWDSRLYSRTVNKRPSNCPYCSTPPKRVLIGFNDAKTWCINHHRENVIAEWDAETNKSNLENYTYGSGKSAWWKCAKNHSWKTTINQRLGNRTDCPICTRTQTSFPEQAVAFYLKQKYEILQRYKLYGFEADIFIPTKSIAIEYDGKRWHENNKNDERKTNCFLENNIRLIRIRETIDRNSVHVDGNLTVIEFIVNYGKYISKDFENAIKTVFEIINVITQNDFTPDINIARDENDIRAYYMSILKNNSVAVVYPHLVSEWDVDKNEGLKPDLFSSRNNKKIWWKCSEGHSWLATINTRGLRNLGCPYCAGQKVTSGKNDLETWCKENESNLLNEWCYDKNTKKPCDIPHTYKEKAWWKCSSGHLWQATIYNRMNGTGCPICNKGRATKGQKHIWKSLLQWCKENESQLYLEWHPTKNGQLTPESVSYGSHNKAWWICANGHEWEAQIKSRTYNHGCPYCSGTNKKAIKGVNDLKTWCEQNNKLYILEEWDYELNNDITPEKVTKGSHKLISWRCCKGHTWKAIVKERTKINGNQCPTCRANRVESKR